MTDTDSRQPPSEQPQVSPTLEGEARPAGFQLVAPYSPAGDQPQAIAKLIAGFESGLARQTL
ncbi:MAG: hypothetical protein ABIQ48_01115, partial [Luteimonas sp.]